MSMNATHHGILATRPRPSTPRHGWSRRRVRFALPALALVAAACSPIRTEVQAEPAVAQRSFETYAWADLSAAPAESVIDDPELRREVRLAVDAALESRGMREVDDADAELLVTQQLGVEEKVKVNDPYYSFWMAEVYEEGALVIDFVDAGTKELVWRGVARSKLRTVGRAIGVHSREFVTSDEQRDWKLTDKVRAILAEFPVRG